MWIWFALTLIPAGDPVPATVAPGEILTVTSRGSGPDVVFVPSLCGSTYGFREPMARAAEAGYRAIAIEPLGFGHSSRPAGADYSLTAQSRRLANVLDQLGTKDAVVVAQGVSASIAFRLAVARPDLVRGIVSLEGGPAESGTSPAFRRAMGLARMVELLGGRKILRSKLEEQLRASSADPSWVTEAILDGYTSGVLENLSAALTAFRAMANAREPEPIQPRLAEINCPVELLLGGAPHEGRLPPAELQSLRGGVRQLRVLTVPDCGHFIAEERPDAVLAAIRRLCRQTLANASADISTPEGR